MPALGDIEGFQLRTMNPHARKWCVVIPIGGSGATGTLLQAPEGLTVTKTGTGVYAVAVMPVSIAASEGKSRVFFGLYSPSLTVTECTVTAHDFNAGTLTFTTSKAGSAAEPASGDRVTLFFEGESE